jgi:hypothetical protein
MRITGLLVGLLAATLAHAEPATARYAPVQLQVARATLDRAQAAAALGERARAAQLAWQAQVDARITWAMTEEPFIRRGAADIAQAAALLMRPAGIEQASTRPP